MLGRTFRSKQIEKIILLNLLNHLVFFIIIFPMYCFTYETWILSVKSSQILVLYYSPGNLFPEKVQGKFPQFFHKYCLSFNYFIGI